MNLSPGRLVLAALFSLWGCSSSPAPGAVTGFGGGGASGSGGASGGGGTPVMNCGDPNQPIDPTAMIDDMESGSDPNLPMEGGRTGSWWAGGDSMSPNALIKPNGGAPSVALPTPRCRSQHAMRVSGQGFTSWAVLSVSMGYGTEDGGAMGLLPYDAHFRSGVTFWARIGDTSSDVVRFAVSDQYSRPEGGFCDATISTGPTACYDLFGVDLQGSISSKNWTQFRIPFGGLAQRNFGLQRKQGLDSSTIYTIEFDFNPGETFDLWVDDIAFY
jgi:hypothetical protein